MSFFEFNNLSKSFDNNVLFSDIAFCFPPTGFVSLLGSSGTGKTTLFYLLTGLENKDKGEIIYRDRKLITKEDFRLFRKECAFVFQEYGVLNYLSAKDNLHLGGFDIDEENITLLNHQNISKMAAFLSGGEKQRLVITKAISINAKILFCDEPTGALDEHNGELVMQELKKLSKNRLIIMVSHNINLVNKYSDIILELKDKTLNTLKTNDKIYKTVPHKAKNHKIHLWKNISISLKSFFHEWHKLLLTFLSLSFSFAALLLVYNLNASTKETIDNAIMTYADFERIKVSEVESNKIEGTSFSISKTKRPDLKLLKSIVDDKVDIEYNLDHFLSGAKITYKNELININIVTFPYGSGLEDIRINEQAKRIFNDLEEKIHIDFSQDITTIFKNDIYNDKINFSMDCYIHYIYSEFDFLNYPCLFISHDALKNYMKGAELSSLSKKRNVFTSLYDRYSAFSDDDEAYSSYSYYIDVRMKKDVNNVIKKLNNVDNINVESRAISVYNALSSSFDMLGMLMEIFTIISLILVGALFYMLNLSLFHQRKKEFALYQTLGFSYVEFVINMLIPIFLMLLTAYFCAQGIFKIGITFLNSLLFQYFKCNIFSFIKLDIPTFMVHCSLLFLVALFFSVLFSIFAQKLKVSEVIKSE